METSHEPTNETKIEAQNEAPPVDMVALDLAALAPDPPEPNARALAAEGVQVGAVAAVASPIASGEGMRVESEGVPLRFVGGRWYEENTGRELRDRNGCPFDASIHVSVNGIPRIARTSGLLSIRSGTVYGKRSRERARLLSGIEPPSIQSRPLPPTRSTIADPAPPRAPMNAGAPNQTTSHAAPIGPSIPGMPPGSPATGPGTPANDLQADALAETMVATLGGTASLMLGPHASPERSEREAMLTAWRAYLRTVDCSYVPPWAVPILASVPWATRVLTAPETAAALEKRRGKRSEENEARTVSDAEAKGGAQAPEPSPSLDEFGRGLD